MTSDVEVGLFHPEELSYYEWEQVHLVSRAAYKHALEETGHEQITDSVVDWKTDEDHTDFIRSHIYPNLEVGSRFNYNQIFTKPRIALVKVGGRVVSYAYGEHNASGGGSPEGPQNDSLSSKALRRGKLLIIASKYATNYLHIRDIASHPNFQGEGYAVQAGRAILQASYKHQPVAAYTDPQKLPHAAQALKDLGFWPTSEANPKEHGLNLVRYQNRSVRDLLDRI
jgi:hypothetical protein